MYTNHKHGYAHITKKATYTEEDRMNRKTLKSAIYAAKHLENGSGKSFFVCENSNGKYDVTPVAPSNREFFNSDGAKLFNGGCPRCTAGVIRSEFGEPDVRCCV